MATALNYGSKTPILRRPRNFQWCWNLSDNLPNCDPESWEKYSDIENEIIEDAFMDGKTEVEIDGDRLVDLGYMLDYTKSDKSNKGCGDKTFSAVVEDASTGIITEGTALGKQREAEWLAQQLLAVKHHGTAPKRESLALPEVIGETCIFLYTRDSFWFKLINKVLRTSREFTEEHVKTLGPFCYLLHKALKELADNTTKIVYRGVNLSDAERAEYTSGREIQFYSFVSTSKNRALAEIYGNTLMIIDLREYQPDDPGSTPEKMLRSRTAYCGASIAHLSNFTEEEEFLIWGFGLPVFVIKKIIFIGSYEREDQLTE
ncbi:unnamed protein product [Rotaria sordida]|uniref:NAD(P)(+)--arginine ADP-ribosyltransferase n=1 Tax=Rotaria sordida TaxID=392033 RepID=A0A815MB69_9BILA|nr:unnamed protein product [Rotaria sordida]CAF1419230.1 unnamed protein product [Rotaria sordida]